MVALMTGVAASLVPTTPSRRRSIPPLPSFFLPAISHRTHSNPIEESQDWVQSPPQVPQRRRGFGGGSISSSSSRAKSDDCDDGDDIEAELYEFMLSSPNPNRFPTKSELIDAGRADLAAAVARRGGWLALGWDLNKKEIIEDTRTSQERIADGSYGGNGGSREMEVDSCDDSGIEGILSRLERQRSLALTSTGTEKQVNGRRFWNPSDLASNGAASNSYANTLGDGESRISRALDPNRSLLADSRSSSCRSLSSDSESTSKINKLEEINGKANPMLETWRTWSLQRTGYSGSDFEAAEIVPTADLSIPDHAYQSDRATDDKIQKTTQAANNGITETQCDAIKKSQSQIRSKIQHLESKLPSVLHSLRSRDSDTILKEVQDPSREELQRLSDSWEFQETEVMKARDKLRSMRAKLAVLEGKLALERIEAQKLVEQKKERLSAAQKAMQLLRTVYIVWPNSASEVLLAGSFDGWTSQRKMERSNMGIFSLYLKLYPGRYEIKFIIDGVWTIDPLRPVVRNNGHENNLLIVT